MPRREGTPFTCNGLGGWTVALCLAVVAALLPLQSAHAQFLDRLEVMPEAQGETEIVVWFAQSVALRSASPTTASRTIRVYFQFVEGAPPGPGALKEYLRSPGQGRLPSFVITFPEIDSAMTVAFASQVSFRVLQTRPRALSVFVRTGAADEKAGVVTMPPRVAAFGEPKPVRGIPDVVYPTREAAPSVASTPPPASASRPSASFEPRPVPGIPDETLTPPPPPVAVTGPPVRKPPPAAAPAAPPPKVVAQGPDATAPPATVAAPNQSSAPLPAPLAAPESRYTEADLLRRDEGKAASGAPAASGRTMAVPSDMKEALERAREQSEGAVSATGAVPLARVADAAQELLAKAKAAMERKQLAEAIRDLNQLLNLPANASSKEAQELIGVAREQYGEIAKARGEYAMFLRLYPDDPAAARVKARMDRLPPDVEIAGEALRQESAAAAGPGGAAGSAQAVRRTDDSPWKITGGISQNFYTGNSHIEILTPPPPGFLTFNQQSLSLTDQKALVTSVDLNARMRSNGVDTRIVFRDSYTSNFLPNQKDVQRLTAAYLEQSSASAGYLYRVGRQSGTFGVIGLIDGLYGAYQIQPQYRLQAVIGQPTQFVSTPISRTIAGVALEKQAQLDKPGGTIYVVRQTADGFVDRQAVGAEARYFNAKVSGFALLDYDMVFRAMNISMAQGNYRFDTGTNVHALVDRRKAPFLLLTSALPAVPGPAPTLAPSLTVTDALLNSGVSVSDLREFAKALTAESSLVNFGVNHPFNEKWQVGADVNFASISGTQGAGVIPAQLASGTSKTLGINAVANNVLLEGATEVLNLTYIGAPTFTGQNYSLNHVSQLLENRLRLDVGLRTYIQNDTSSASLRRFSPTLRLSFRIRPNVALEGETGAEKSHQVDAQGTQTDSTRQYFYLGYRWDLF